MASRIRLYSLAVGVTAAVLAAGPAHAQSTKQDTAMPAANSASIRPDDCKKLPGGNAPINRLARLDGGISVRNLDLTYLGKPLFELTDQDYLYLQALWRTCSTFDAETAATVAARLRSLVEDAKAVRRDSLDWIKRTEQQAKALKPGQEGIETIHDLWQQMLNREFEMLASDMSYIAAVLSKRRDELYQTPQSRQRTLVSPFDPGPPDSRTLRGGG